jgi:DNA-binding NtrC family response regulator
MPVGDYNLPAPLSHYREQDERQILFRALFELKTDIMGIKQQLEMMNNNRGNVTSIDGLVIPEDKLDSFTYSDFEQEFLTYYWNKYHGNISRIANRLKVSNRTLYRKFKNYGLKNGKV